MAVLGGPPRHDPVFLAEIGYQPAGRYWAFQGMETGIFVLLAAILITVAAVVLLRLDA